MIFRSFHALFITLLLSLLHNLRSLQTQSALVIIILSLDSSSAFRPIRHFHPNHSSGLPHPVYVTPSHPFVTTVTPSSFHSGQEQDGILPELLSSCSFVNSFL